MIYLILVLHLIPLSTLHLPVTWSGLAKLINGGSSNVNTSDKLLLFSLIISIVSEIDIGINRETEDLE